jgi:anhydro-N-acetylmuramic acid kinase
MIVAGIMSGTSADGIDVAFTRITQGRDGQPKLRVLGHEGFRYPKAVREAALRVMEGISTNAAELSRLNWRLGEVYADCAIRARTALAIGKLDLIGLHGQTIYHQSKAEPYAGAPIRCTWQIGEPAVLRERLGVPVINDFRPADLAAGGQGAPLVPMLDFHLFRSPTKSRILLNLGGIANVTVIPAAASIDHVMAFDTGPANMVIDAVMQAEFSKPFDRNGKIAATGHALKPVVAELLGDPYFAAAPPKSCGREQYGAAFVERFRKLCADASPADTIATATELTAASIFDAYARFCWPHLGQHAPLAGATEVIAAGGGTRNATLMKRLREGFAAYGVKLLATDDLGIKSEAKEAVAFALLAWLTWHRLPGNIPSATGATHPAVLGKLSW